MRNKHWFAFTPGGTMCMDTAAETKEECIAKLLKAAAHMPYGTWENFKKRGYRVEEIEIDHENLDDAGDLDTDLSESMQTFYDQDYSLSLFREVFPKSYKVLDSIIEQEIAKRQK